MITTPSSNEISLTRIYDAPSSTVWNAWTDPNQKAQWWGPRGFTISTHHSDVRTGGSWSYTMHGPDGVEYVNKTQYFEVERHRKLVYDHGGNDENPPLFRVTSAFTELHEKTRMDMTMTFETPVAAENARNFIKQAGGNTTWDRLAEFLAKETSGKEIFVINRSFDAPIQLMYEIWTTPAHVSHWLAPTGFTMGFLKSDIAPGGSTFYFMSADSGPKMHGRADYLKLERPNLIVYTQQFCDENEIVTRHPLAPDLARNDADHCNTGGRRACANPSYGSVGDFWSSKQRGARNIHPVERRDEPRLDGLIR